MTLSPFFTLHSELPREGPGEAADVVWAVDLAGASGAARVVDVACGPGADVGALLGAMPDASVLAVDGQAHFVAEVQARFVGEGRVTAQQGDMAALSGAFDFIWCAGAVYFLGVTEALTAWRGALARGGAIAFSQPCLFEGAGAEARAFWGGDAVGTRGDIEAWVADAGYEVLGMRVVSDTAWEAYYEPMETRIAQLRGRDGMDAVLDEAAAEIAGWRELKRETGYLLCVVRPLGEIE